MACELSSIERHDDLLIPVDTETVAATRHEPTAVDGPAPALLMYLPYRHRDYYFANCKPLTRYFARHGYEVVVADIVGTGASSGRKPEPFSADEGHQAAALVDWLADQSWTTGRVGMYGISYGGETALRAAAAGPDALEAIVPIHATHTMFRGHSHGGRPELYRMGGRWGPHMQALQALPPTHRDPDGRWARVWSDHLDELREGTPWLVQLLTHDRTDEYWQRKDIPVGDIDVPTFAAGGWRDLFPTATIEYVRSLAGPAKLVMGPWRHNFPYLGLESAIDLRRQALEWFDHFLRDVDNGAADGVRIQFWTERHGGGEIDGVWRETDRWPVADGPDDDLTLALGPTGLLPAAELEDRLEREYEYDHTVGIDSTARVVQAICPPPDTGVDDARSLTFETEPLETPFELTGTGEVTLRLAASTPDPNLSVRIVDVRPDGRAHLVTQRECRVSRRSGDRSTSDLVPGEAVECALNLRPTSHLFEAGHRIRLAISAGLFPAMVPPRRHGSLTVRSSPAALSTVRLPGRRHEREPTFPDAIEMDGPDESVPRVSSRFRDRRQWWESARDHTVDSATVRVGSSRDLDLPHVEGLSANQDIEATIEADDPTSLVLRQSYELTVDYGTETVAVAVESRVTAETLHISTRVTADGDTLFEDARTRTGYRK